MADEKTIYRMKTPSGDPVRVEEAWKDSDGNLLNKKVTTDTAQTITGAKTFSSQVIATGGVKTDKVTSTDGTEVLSYNGTTTALKGKADRPTYNGSNIALQDDFNDVVFFVQTGDALSMFANTPYSKIGNLTYFKNKTIYVFNGKIATKASWAFCGIPCKKVVIDSIGSTTVLDNSFQNNAGYMPSAVEVFDTSKVTSVDGMFKENRNISEIPAFDFSAVESANYFCYNCKSLRKFRPTGLKVSFNISYSTQFTAEELRLVIDNVADVSSTGTTQTLTLGSTNLAKLNADDITTANNKGWTLA